VISSPTRIYNRYKITRVQVPRRNIRIEKM
jgi:hypothetical protein